MSEHAHVHADAGDPVSKRCALCGMEIVGDPVVRVVDGVEVYFDSEDCARLYQAAFDAGMLDEVLANEPEHRRGLLEQLGLHGRTTFVTIDGMWCAACAKVAEKILRQGEGVTDAQVSFAAAKGRIDYDPRTTDVDELLHRIEKLGYSPRLVGSAESEESSSAEERLLIQVIVAFAFGMQEMVLYIVRLYPAYSAGDFSSPQVRWLQGLALLLATPALFYGGWTFLRGAAHELRTRTPGMDTLVALGTLSAYTYSLWATVVGGHATYFDSVTMIVQFVMIGRYIEMAGGARARKDVRGLMELQPERAWVRAEDGSLSQAPSWQLQPGAVIVVKPGERVPLDAVVIGGGAHADESLLTGESAVVAKTTGDEIWAGTLVSEGSLTARVTRDVDSSRLSGIRGLVERTLESRAPVERLADRASLYLTLGVISLAVLTLAGWIAVGKPPTEALIAAVAVLVVACPCALGLATPLVVSVALGGTAREGVLVRNGAALETAGRTNAVVLDKTGTVTLGVLAVTGTSGDDAELLRLAAAVERYSEHPLARAIVSAAENPVAATDFVPLAGFGASAALEDGSRVTVGRLEMLPEPPPATLAIDAETRAAGGESIVWVARGDEVLGFIGLRDELDPSAPAAVAALRERGIEPVLLSGDSQGTVRGVAERLGVERYSGRLTPEAKAAYIEAMRAGGALVAMVGDGVNDAPALATADLSITVAGGADVAGQTSDVVLGRDDLELVPWFIESAGKTRRVIVQNIGWAIAYNAVALPLAVFGVITPGIAAAAMACSSLLVVGNSLRLRGMLHREIAPESRAVTVAVGAQN